MELFHKIKEGWYILNSIEDLLRCDGEITDEEGKLSVRRCTGLSWRDGRYINYRNVSEYVVKFSNITRGKGGSRYFKKRKAIGWGAEMTQTLWIEGKHIVRQWSTNKGSRCLEKGVKVVTLSPTEITHRLSEWKTDADGKLYHYILRAKFKKVRRSRRLALKYACYFSKNISCLPIIFT